MSLETRELYAFGEFELDAGERRLRRAGQPVPLTPKAFDTLLVLVRSAGSLISKDQLLAAVWPDVAVEEATLAQNISTLRKALAEAPGGHSYIETVPKSGYRFAGAVRRTNVDARGTVSVDQTLVAPALRRSRVGLFIGLAALAIGVAVFVWKRFETDRAPDRARTLAIVPFRNLHPSADANYLGASLADAITSRLAELPQLVVRPSSYMHKYVGPTVDPRQVAHDVNADAVLTGTFVREGDRLRIYPELVDTRRADVLWRDTIDVTYDGVLAVQDRVARRVVEALNVRLSPAEAERFTRSGPRNAKAYELYLRGLEHRAANRWGQGIRVMELSVTEDPDYAPAWVNFGWMLYGYGFFQGGGEQYTRRALEAFERALALDPQSVEARIAKAMYHLESGQVEQAAPLLREVVRLAPNSAMGRWWLGYAYRYAGMLEESVRETNAAFELDPRVGTGTTSNTFLYVGDHRRFLDTLPAGESARTTFYRGLGLLYGGDRSAAAVQFERAFQLDPSLIHARVGKAMGHAMLGERAPGVAELRRIEALDKPRDGEMLYKVAQAYAMLDAPDDAMRVLAQAVEQDFVCVPYFETDILLAAVRSDRRFAPVIERARERQRQLRKAFGS